MKRQKYGYIYRTHLFGNPTVRVTGADNVRHVLMGENKLVSVQWPASVRTILGSDTLSNVHGSMHKSKKKVSLETNLFQSDGANVRLNLNHSVLQRFNKYRGALIGNKMFYVLWYTRST